MKQLTDKEKEHINKLIKVKKEGKIGELQSAKLLRKSLSCIAVIWTVEPKSFTIYAKENETNFKSIFFDIVDYLVFIEYLDNSNLIKLLPSISEENKPQDNIVPRKLYDHEEYTYNKDTPITKDFEELEGSQNITDGDFFYIYKGSRKYILAQKKQKLDVNIVDLLEKYATKIIYPLPELEEYKRREYKTLENWHLEKQMCYTRCSVIITAIAVIITAIVPFFTQCHSNKSSEKQIQRLENAILNNKTEIPEIISTTITNVTPSRDVALPRLKNVIAK